MTPQLLAALERFHSMGERDVKEVAYTYLLGALNADLDEDVREIWEKSFSDESERTSLEQELQSLQHSEKGTQFLALCVETTLADRPETEQLLIDCVEGAGKKMWAIEAALVTMAAAALLREIFIRGRKKNTTVKRWKKVNDTWVYEEIETTEYAGEMKGLGKILTGLAECLTPQ